MLNRLPGSHGVVLFSGCRWNSLKFPLKSPNFHQFRLHNHSHRITTCFFLVANPILLGKLYCGRKFCLFVTYLLLDHDVLYDAGNGVTHYRTDRMNSFRIDFRPLVCLAASILYNYYYNYCVNFRDRRGESCKLVIPTVARSNALIRFPANTAFCRWALFRHVLCKPMKLSTSTVIVHLK